MYVHLYDHQKIALSKMKRGCILCGGVGTGKSRTSLAYYYYTQGGNISKDKWRRMLPGVKDLYIITTARKRDTLEWEDELYAFELSTFPQKNTYNNKVVVDSWNNIAKYKDVEGAFFIFDEQRVVGSGAWVKAFLKISKKNHWILLSATPGDTWMDYIPVFIANGFFKNKTDFINKHVIYSRFSKFPKVDRFINTGALIKMRRDILVPMEYKRKTHSHHEDIYVDFDRILYKTVVKNRFDIYKDEPLQNASGLCYCLRRIVNSDESRILEVKRIVKEKQRVIVFYNYDYELDILKNANYGPGFEVREWNGHFHEPLPTGKKWVYLVQYQAGNEGWNCITSDTIIFYSQSYSYKVMQQAAGRIDRLNTPFEDLYYYHLKSRSGIDLAISVALKEKGRFNESMFEQRLK